MSFWWESLVQIRRSDGTKGSGIFISATEVLTAAHVVTRDGVSLDASDVNVLIRYRSQTTVPVAVSVLASWTATGTTAADVALLQVESAPDLGLPTVFGVPAASASAMLEGVGFDAQSDDVRMPRGNVACEVTSDGELLLFSRDFSPDPGMSGGPVCAGLPGGVCVVGILTRQSSSGLIGLPLIAAVLAELRSGVGD